MKHKKSITKKDSKTKIEIQKTIFEKIYFYFFLLLPIIYSDKLVDPVLIPRQIYLSIFVFIVGVLICYQISIKKLNGDFTFLKTPLFLGFSIFLISILISFFQSIVISESIYTFSKVLIEVCFLALTSYLIIQKQLSIRSLIKSIIVFLAIILLIVLFQSFQIYGLEENFFKHVNEITSTNANKNLVSSILFIGFPLVIYLSRFSKTWKIFSIILLVFILLFVWILQTKAVIISLILFLVIGFILILTSKSNEIKKSKVRIIGISAIILLLVLTVISFKNKEKLPHLFSSNTVKTRFLLWHNSIKMINDHVIQGVGAGNWQINFPKYGLDQFGGLDVKTGMTTYQRPHNDFIWVLSEVGIVGFIAYISLFIFVLYYLFRLIYKTNEKSKILYILIFSGIIGYIFIAFSDFPFERIEHQILLYSLFSIVIGDYYLNFQSQLQPISVMNNTLVLFSILTILFIGEMIVTSKRYSGESHTAQIFEAHKTGNWNFLIDEVELAENSYYKITPMSIPLIWYKGVAVFSLGNIKEAKLIFQKALKIHPYNIHILNNLGSCYEKLGNHFLAEVYYKKALAISSHFAESLLNLSAVYFNSKNFVKAFETIDKCPVSCNDQKYIIFLPVILQSKIDKMIKNTKDENIKNALIQLKSDNIKITNLYFDSKSKRVRFGKYLTKTFKL